MKTHAVGNGAGRPQPSEGFPQGESRFVVAGLEHNRGGIDAWPEADLLDLAHDLAVPLDEFVGRDGRIDLHRGVVEQHLALEIDPTRAFARFSVRHAREERLQLARKPSEDLFAVVERDAADQVQASGVVHYVVFSSFCSERRYFGTGTPGWVLGQLV